MPKKINKARLDELIDEATVDCYGEEEEHTALLTMIEEQVVCPFHAKVIGETVEVTRFEWPKSGYRMLAVCRHKGRTDRVDISSLEWIEPRPRGFEWIAAYQAWCKHNA
ncbi:MAG TPA: calcium-binding protein [Pyrinomonadaceae bacterium]|nr:calcium-binding protein [Pyrinomonadaceae bacterium]